ncbi:phosphoribosyltransferase [Nocardia goodfellowii]
MVAATLALDLTWGQLEEHLDTMTRAVVADGVPSVVVGVLRGGMVPAVMLAHRLGVRDVRGIGLAHTLSEGVEAAKRPAPLVANPASLGHLGACADVLLVDDVAGSGASLETAAALLPAELMRVRRAVVVVNTVNWNASNIVAPQHFCDFIGTTCAGWVRFPWEIR